MLFNARKWTREGAMAQKVTKCSGKVWSRSKCDQKGALVPEASCSKERS